MKSVLNRVCLEPLTILDARHREKMAKYREEMIQYYAKELVKYGECQSTKKALKISKMQVGQHLPESLDAQGQYLFDIAHCVGGDPIGYLWYEWYMGELEACLMYLYIFPNERLRGWGKRALDHYEALVLTRGINKSALYVFMENKAAVNLYLKAGYSIDRRVKAFNEKFFTRYRMVKSLR